ncbi:MAG TPA: hypothetical protein VFA22_06735 [Stellaceae bacterium]|nr:hypothetical protein [Stellaceae bacterium]
MIDLFLPSALDLAGWAAVAAVGVALIGLGRLATGGRAAPEAALVAGWGAAALLLTLWGVTTPASLRHPGAAVLAAGAVGLVLPRARLGRADWARLARIAVLALPLLAVLASARPSEPDTFLNLLPNAGYLYDHAAFPGVGRPPVHSYLPAAPYNLQLAAFLADLLTPDFAANALIAFNLLLQLAAGLLLARLAAGERAPGWGASALGLLLATALNPGFVPRFHLSSYSEASVTVTLAFAGCEAARALECMAARRSAKAPLITLALSLAALVNIKQDSVALAAAVLATAAALTWSGGGAARRWTALALAALPAAVLYFAWRWYALTRVPGGELEPLPLAAWQWGALPLILWHMLETIGQKLFFYLVLAATLAAAAWRARRRGVDLAGRAAALLGGCTVLYNAALLFAYVGHFPGTMGSDAHSYFRYSTHLSLLMMAAIVLLARQEARERVWQASPRARRLAPAALIAAMLAAPLVFLPFLRFDLETPALRVWRIARGAAPDLGDRDRVALILPGDNGTVTPALETILRTVPPRHPDLALTTITRLVPGLLDALAAEGYGAALLSCAPAGFADVPAGSGALFRRDAMGWTAVRIWRYAPPAPGARWSHQLADAPLCLSR